MHRKPYCWVIVVSGAIQIMVYITRIISIHNPEKLGPYAAWFVGILVRSALASNREKKRLDSDAMKRLLLSSPMLSCIWF